MWVGDEGDRILCAGKWCFKDDWFLTKYTKGKESQQSKFLIMLKENPSHWNFASRKNTFLQRKTRQTSQIITPDGLLLADQNHKGIQRDFLCVENPPNLKTQIYREASRPKQKVNTQVHVKECLLVYVCICVCAVCIVWVKCVPCIYTCVQVWASTCVHRSHWKCWVFSSITLHFNPCEKGFDWI